MKCQLGKVAAVISLALLTDTPTLAAPTITADAARLPDNTFRSLDLSGQIRVIGENPATRAIAFVFMSTECPISRKYVPQLNRIYAQTHSTGKVEFYGILSDPSVTRKAAADFTREFGVQFSVLFDATGELADLCRPTHVPEAFVFDASHKLVYRGRIDDVYREIGRRQLDATTHDLADAIQATLDGRVVATPQTTPVGCLFETAPIEQRMAKATFNREIAPLVFANCAECHRPGEVAPFALLTYHDVAKRSEWITDVTKQRQMPPWNASPGHGRFLGERILSDSQIEWIAAWAKAGAPEGSSDDLPPEPTFPKGWRLGQPDLVIEAPHDTTVPAAGPDLFQHYVIDFDVPEDKTLIGFEFHPGNPAVVHHAVLLYDSFGAARAKDAKTPEPGYQTFGSVGVPVTGVVGVWAPGMTPRFFPENIGMPLPKGADLLLQLHYHPSGREEIDRSRIGLYFADRPRAKSVSRVPLVLGSLMLDVPAGATDHKVASSVELPAPMTILSALPHMHLIGREMRVMATPPSGSPIDLIWIPRWNFYWQDNYVYKEPVRLPAGTRIDIVGSFDNSEENPTNPSRPPKRVLFGNDSDDEMFFAVFQTVSEDPDAERMIERALLTQFQRDWARNTVAADARPRIVAEAIEFFGGGEVFLRILMGNSPTSGGR